MTHDGYQVTNSSGNLVDLDGAEMDGQYTSPARPGFPGFSPTPAQSLAYVADMQESGIPVTYGYISDMHERKACTTGSCTTATATTAGNPVGPGDSCYVDNAKAYDDAFQKFFERLQQDGITPANTLYMISAEENDQFDGANVGRATQPDARRMRRRDRGVQLRGGTDRRGAGQHQGSAVDHPECEHAVRHRTAGRVDLRARTAAAGRPDGAAARA